MAEANKQFLVIRGLPKAGGHHGAPRVGMARWALQGLQARLKAWASEGLKRASPIPHRDFIASSPTPSTSAND
jgi:hypothetical protein